MRKHERELRKENPGASIETTNGNHLRLRLPDGQSAIAASIPGDRRFLAKVRAEVRAADAIEATGALLDREVPAP